MYIRTAIQASKVIHAVLSQYGPAEKLGMDETFVDVTEVRAASLSAARAMLERYRAGVYRLPLV